MQHEQRKAGTSRQCGTAHRFEFEFSSLHQGISVYNQVLCREIVSSENARLRLFAGEEPKSIDIL
jgi:hypothetical protein